MGASLSWFAVSGCDLETVLSDMGWELDGPPVGGGWPARVSIGELPGGWILIVFNRDLDQAFDPDTTRLSNHGPAVACAIEEHVMFQEARGYQAGAQAWRITHDPDKGRSLYHLEVVGHPPDTLKPLHEAAVAEQEAEGGEDADVDIISDVPLLVAKAICGFKHDDQWPPELAFTPIRRPKPSRATAGGGFFSRLFGRT